MSSLRPPAARVLHNLHAGTRGGLLFPALVPNLDSIRAHGPLGLRLRHSAQLQKAQRSLGRLGRFLCDRAALPRRWKQRTAAPPPSASVRRPGPFHLSIRATTASTSAVGMLKRVWIHLMRRLCRSGRPWRYPWNPAATQQNIKNPIGLLVNGAPEMRPNTTTHMRTPAMSGPHDSRLRRAIEHHPFSTLAMLRTLAVGCDSFRRSVWTVYPSLRRERGGWGRWRANRSWRGCCGRVISARCFVGWAGIMQGCSIPCRCPTAT